MRSLLLAAALSLTVPALAQTLPMPPPGGVIVSPDGRTVISSDVCAELGGPVSGVPGADYTPGVDIQGNAVAPADLPGGAAPLALDNFPIVITTNLRRRFGVPPNARLFQGDGFIGLVTMRDGRAYFNGQPITDNEQSAMIAACRETGR